MSLLTLVACLQNDVLILLGEVTCFPPRGFKRLGIIPPQKGINSQIFGQPNDHSKKGPRVMKIKHFVW